MHAKLSLTCVYCICMYIFVCIERRQKINFKLLVVKKHTHTEETKNRIEHFVVNVFGMSKNNSKASLRVVTRNLVWDRGKRNYSLQ